MTPDHLELAMGGHRLQSLYFRADSNWVIAISVVLATLATATILTYLTGGTHRAFPHLFYIPIIAGAYYFGARGGIALGLLATLACGPLMPLDVDAGTMQSVENWATRGAFFIGVGLISGVGAQSLRRRLLERDQLHKEAVVAFVATIDAKSPYTARHSERVAELAAATGVAMELPQDEIEQLRWSGLLHDVGKLWVPDSVLEKNGPLSEHEWEAIRAHPVHSAYFISSIAQFNPYCDAARHHHERVDGRGYPDGLREREIPLHARILAAADAFEAMTSDRPYRPGMSFEEAKTEMRVHAGTQFDPLVVDALILALDEHPAMLDGWRRGQAPQPIREVPLQVNVTVT